ncbi:MAG: LytTR family DNA-binding domain-containing protein [Pyrinomonadaceae bacterium]
MIKETGQEAKSELYRVPVWQRRWARLAIIWGIWTFIGLIFTLQFYFASYRSERPTSFVNALYMQMIWAYLFALATPLVLCAVTRMPLERDNWVRNALLHIPISIVLGVLLTALGGVLIWLRWGWPLGKPLTFESIIRFVIGNFSEAIGIYLLISLTGYAFSYYTRFREGQVRTLQLDRSSIVRIDRIQELQPWFHGEYRIILQNGTQLTLSRNYRDKLQEALGKLP